MRNDPVKITIRAGPVLTPRRPPTQDELFVVGAHAQLHLHHGRQIVVGLPQVIALRGNHGQFLLGSPHPRASGPSARSFLNWPATA